MARQHPVRWIAGQLERTMKSRGDLTGRFPGARELPEAAVQGPFDCGRDAGCLAHYGPTLGDGRGGCGAGNRAARNRWVPAPIPGSVLSSLIHPRTKVAIGLGSGQHSRTGFDSDSIFLESYSIRGQGIIERWDLKTNRTGLKACGGRTQGVQLGVQRLAAWGVGRSRHEKEYWAGAEGTADSLGPGRPGMRFLDNPEIGRIQMGNDGGRLTNGREDPGNQGWDIETLTAGSGTHSRRRNAEYR